MFSPPPDERPNRPHRIGLILLSSLARPLAVLNRFKLIVHVTHHSVSVLLWQDTTQQEPRGTGGAISDCCLKGWIFCLTAVYCKTDSEVTWPDTREVFEP